MVASCSSPLQKTVACNTAVVSVDDSVSAGSARPCRPAGAARAQRVCSWAEQAATCPDATQHAECSGGWARPACAEAAANTGRRSVALHRRTCLDVQVARGEGVG